MCSSSGIGTKIWRHLPFGPSWAPMFTQGLCLRSQNFSLAFLLLGPEGHSSTLSLKPGPGSSCTSPTLPCLCPGPEFEEDPQQTPTDWIPWGPQGELVTASKAIIEKEYQPHVVVSTTGPNPFNTLTDRELEEYRREVERKQKGPEGECSRASWFPLIGAPLEGARVQRPCCLIADVKRCHEHHTTSAALPVVCAHSAVCNWNQWHPDPPALRSAVTPSTYPHIQ